MAANANPVIDLQTLVAAFTAAQQAQLPPQPRNFIKTPDSFNGDRAKYESFKKGLLLYVSNIRTDKDKILCALSYLTEGEADEWAQWYVQLHQADIDADAITWADFLAALDKQFEDPRAAELALAKWQKMSQGKLEAHTFFLAFDEQIKKSKYTSPAHHDMAIVAHLNTHINPALALAVQNAYQAEQDATVRVIDMLRALGTIATDAAANQRKADALAPISYERYKTLAIAHDPAVRRFNNAPWQMPRAQSTPQQPRTQQAPAFTPRAPTTPAPAPAAAATSSTLHDEPMDVDRHRRRDTRKCFGCGQEGHIARNCPNRTRTTLRRLKDEGALDYEEMRRMVQENDAKEKKDTNAESFVTPQ